mmetsp:Transcript_9311/g.12666  ORF Transcript_9311/g.12666 Transcript_9311/m.12666 type:complete len:148 (+) Transcript_9311:603-1046(+)
MRSPDSDLKAEPQAPTPFTVEQCWRVDDDRVEESQILQNESMQNSATQLKLAPEQVLVQGDSSGSRLIRLRSVATIKVKPRMTFTPIGEPERVMLAVNRMNKGLGLVCSYFDYTRLVEHQNVIVRLDLNSKTLRFESQALIQSRIDG